ncbi:lipid-transfer protein [Mycobacteroides franklinii]|uniref:propanoyl-CoA C-acyltransferase n=1 Tax=Mycobacteroides franklinii TaxID=948102 RepID=A0A4R8R8G3_9MYCO|nr:lipid-transfer protein [Mycobacteroides franklinii]TDZ42407.1 3-oxoadipyl-CoA/3-oxo-5,6-dehydrosuberyl-CoA thiolase [Mycobacteroides franklinii]TDZ52555.1 3-oxoadipyl-CoA/3-oxo-5,6-dehydrosuberyl-CoA thiolase [Mycobacteroides franklinii]TDZ55962.1 3-oxoadipyl-CoA/3-oxo-5,6-dehydrosuberyl-CoA thiolase [Mycobacteroides franklinii]TDZ62903.1 3-oxoadipyl-CoA/3-oxo-5,6-dehydrosuberyl-CoA thiolase [Mycobacteroides franklinii]TDZ69300.1 3-oxoadipyl-CoA/3-oxo-5,6-dehydrosuberyl-CoA thiolase [Mycoba
MKHKYKAFVIGVGMTKFEKPGSREGWDYPAMVKESGTKALDDASVRYEQVEQAFVGNVYGDSCSGHRALYELGHTGIPIYNVNSNCSTGSTALFMAANAIRSGQSDVVMAAGFEKMERGSLSMKFTDRESPLLPQLNRLGELTPPQMPMTAWMFAAAAEEYMREYGLTAEQLAWIGYKNHKHSVNNPYSQFQDEYSLEDILSSRSIVAPLTKLQCSPTSDGSAAAIVASEEFVDKHGLADQAVEIVGQSTVTDRADTFDGTAAGIVGAHMNKAAVHAVYEQAQIGPEDIDVIELHDCFSANEILVYEALGLCEQGEAGKLIDNEDTTFGGKWVVNPSGGLISKGHPLGATGLAQCAELNWQIRGLADKRQVAGAATKDGVALQHNIGLGGSVVVTAYRPAQR